MEKIYLKDIAGYDEEKQEVKKIIEVLKNHKQYEELGAYIPKGLILSGQPGVGKTMLAKAIASESNVPLFEFESDECEDEAQTIKSIKELFNKAKENAPSIIFIDELDELVMNETFYSDYSRKVLKILLTEIDGIESSSGVMVIATTNNRRFLPPALIRSGRMDKRISMPMPDLKSREEIFKLYLRKVDLNNFDAKLLAAKTSNFSGADIKNLINETIIDCKSKGIKEIKFEHFESMIPVILFQDIRKSGDKQPSDIVCYHEIGHFITIYKLDKEIGSISTDRFGEVEGYTQLDEKPKKNNTITKNTLHNTLIKVLSGMAGEEVYLKDISGGAAHDIKRAKRAIKILIDVGAFGFNISGNPFSYSRHDFGLDRENASNPSQNKVINIEELESKLLTEAYDEAKKILIENRNLADKIYRELKVKARLSNNELEKIINKA